MKLRIKPTSTLNSDQIKLAISSPLSEKDAMTPTVETLTEEFSQALNALLTPNQINEVGSSNAQETHLSICHTHDFCDANVVLHEVFLSHGMNPAEEGGMAKWGRLWDESWSLAKANKFQEN